MSFVAHASCPSCSSCSARADVLIEGGYLIGSSFACDDCGTWWVEIREQHAWPATPRSETAAVRTGKEVRP